MTLGQLIEALVRLRDRDPCVGESSPVLVEGYNEDDEHLQGSIESVTTEARCEDDDEFQAIYINIGTESSR